MLEYKNKVQKFLGFQSHIKQGVGLIFILIILIYSSVIQAAIITFEENIPGPEKVSTQYCINPNTSKGVNFLKWSRIFVPNVATSSPTHALTNQLAPETFDFSDALDISFTTGQSKVSVKVGLDRMYKFNITAVMTAFSTKEPPYGYVTYSNINLGKGPTPITKSLSVISAARDIKSVRIMFSGPSYGQYAVEVIDDLVFSNEGPACTTGPDTTPPKVRITEPDKDGVKVRSPNIALSYEAKDTQSGIAEIAVIYLDSNGKKLESFYACGGQGGPGCIYTSSNPLEVKSGFHTVIPPNTRTIQVKAKDFAGNSGHAKRIIYFSPPGPNTNIWVMGMEITQGIQSWMIKNTARKSTGPPKTVYYPSFSSTTVPLIANRTTIVRVYVGVENIDPAPMVDVTGELKCYTDYSYKVPFYPGPASISPMQRPAQNNLPAHNQIISLKPTDTLDNIRKKTTLSLNFELPHKWLSGGLKYLEATVYTANNQPEGKGHYDAANNIRMSHLRFFAVPDFAKKFCYLIQINIKRGNQTFIPTSADIKCQMDFVRQTYPIDETTVTDTPHRVWNWTQDSPTGWDCDGLYNDLKSNFGHTLIEVIHSPFLKFRHNKLVAFGVVGKGFGCSGLGGTAFLGGVSYGRCEPGDGPNGAAHEIGHALGFSHPGPPGQGHGDECPPCESDWPWPHGTIGDAYGFDILNMDVITPGTSETDPHDFMSYGEPYWVSTRNWIRIFNIFSKNNFPYPKAKNKSPSISGNPKIIQAVRDTPFTRPEATDKSLLVQGRFTEETGWILEPAYELDLPNIIGENPGEGEYSIELLNMHGEVMVLRRFSATCHIEGGIIPPPSFVELIPLPDGIVTIRFSKKRRPITMRTRSEDSPAIELLSPTESGFEEQAGSRVIRWKSSDNDSELLNYMVQYSSGPKEEGKRVWSTLAIGQRTEELKFDPSGLPGGEEALIRVLATDGFNTSSIGSPPFPVQDKPPKVQIISPRDYIIIEERSCITFRGTGFDMEDGIIPSQSLSWTSMKDGLLGTGRRLSISTLSPGVHEIILNGQDSVRQNNSTVTVVEVIKRPNSQPIANAGADRSFYIGHVINLDGSGSSDPDNDPLSYHWRIVSKPLRSNPYLADPRTRKPRLHLDLVGNYEIELTVNDGQVASVPDHIKIIGTNTIREKNNE